MKAASFTVVTILFAAAAGASVIEGTATYCGRIEGDRLELRDEAGAQTLLCESCAPGVARAMQETVA